VKSNFLGISMVVGIIVMIICMVTGFFGLAAMLFGLIMVIGGCLCIKDEKQLGMSHFMITFGSAVLFVAISLTYFSNSVISIFLRQYGGIMAISLFGILPIYFFIIVDKWKYSNMMKKNPIETVGTCIGHVSHRDDDGTTYSPRYKYYIDGKWYKTQRDSYSSDALKCVPTGTETKILVNPHNFEHVYIFKTHKEKRSDYIWVVIFNLVTIGAYICVFMQNI